MTAPFLQKLDQPPIQTDPYLLADYVEVLCLVNPDWTISQAEVLGRFQKDADLVAESDFAEQEGETEAEKDDRNNRKIKDAFRQMRYRVGAFGDSYPFRLSEESGVLFRHKDITYRHKLYIFLLISSNLRFFSRSERNKITSGFEAVSSIALKSYLIEKAQVHIFGKNILGEDSRYKGKKLEKIKLLAQDLREQTTFQSEEQFSEHDTGDAGLDIVAWVPIGDDAQSFLIILAQCACTLNWVTKQYSASYDSWSPFIRFTARPNNMIFIPFCFRGANGGWYQYHDVKKSILVDRLRLIKLLENYDNRLHGLPYNIVKRAIDFEESLF